MVRRWLYETFRASEGAQCLEHYCAHVTRVHLGRQGLGAQASHIVPLGLDMFIVGEWEARGRHVGQDIFTIG